MNGAGETYVEEHKNISLSDFEIMYGNESNTIIEMELLKDEEK